MQGKPGNLSVQDHVSVPVPAIADNEHITTSSFLDLVRVIEWD